MKKLILFFTLIMVLFYANSTYKKFTLLNYFEGEYQAYTKTKINSNSIDLGFCYLNKNTTSKHIIGESISTNNIEIAKCIKDLKAKVIKTEYLNNGLTIIYSYSPLIDSSVNIENKKVNLQIAFKDDHYTIGWPLILGSF